MTDVAADAASRAPRWQVLLAFASVYLIWGSTYLAIRFAIETLPSFLMAGTRFFVAGAILYAWARLRGAPRATGWHWASAAMIGTLLLVCGNGGVVWAEHRVPSGLTALLVGVVPIWTVLVDWLRPGGRRPGAGVFAGLLVGLAGVILLIAPGELAGGSGVDPFGAAVLMCSTLAWAIGSVYSSRVTLPESPLLATAMEMLSAGTILLLIGLGAGEAAQVRLDALSLRSVASLGYLIVFGSLVAFTAFVWLLRVTTPARVATYAYVNPVVAVLLGWAFAGEPLGARSLLAAALIVSAVVLITTARSRGAASKTAVASGAPARPARLRWMNGRTGARSRRAPAD